MAALGAGLLGYMGWKTWRAAEASAVDAPAQSPWTARRQVVFAVSVSLLNPHALMDTLVVIGGSAAAYLMYVVSHAR